MSLINIDQFTERNEIRLHFCPICKGFMNEVPIAAIDAFKLLIGKKKIIKRYKCEDCLNEVKEEK